VCYEVCSIKYIFLFFCKAVGSDGGSKQRLNVLLNARDDTQDLFKFHMLPVSGLDVMNLGAISKKSGKMEEITKD
jgi:hypothetical protein